MHDTLQKGNAFKTFWRNGLEKELKEEKKELIKDKKTLTKEKLRHIIKNKINKKDKLLRKNFAKFFFIICSNVRYVHIFLIYLLNCFKKLTVERILDFERSVFLLS